MDDVVPRRVDWWLVATAVASVALGALTYVTVNSDEHAARAHVATPGPSTPGAGSGPSGVVAKPLSDASG